MMGRAAGAFLAAIGIIGCIAHGGPARGEDAAPPVVVELFTSQGCSSCPPADKLLGELSKRPDVLALGFHVDYWDYIGWKDPYASKLATKRQKQYAETFKLSFVYTPQMVVAGSTEAVGSDRSAIETAVEEAKTRAATHPSLALERRSDGGLTVHVGAAEVKRPATVWLACFDRQQSTPVARGENAGTTLTNYHIVRHFESLGIWKGQMLDLSVGPDQVEHLPLPDPQGFEVADDVVVGQRRAGILAARDRRRLLPIEAGEPHGRRPFHLRRADMDRESAVAPPLQRQARMRGGAGLRLLDRGLDRGPVGAHGLGAAGHDHLGRVDER